MRAPSLSAALPLCVLLVACGDDGAPAADAGQGSLMDGATDQPDDDAGQHAGPHADASTQDAGSTADAGRDAGTTTPADPTDRKSYGLGSPSRCASSGALLCEDFEGAKLDSATWSLQTWGSGSATLDSTRAARGGKSLHITQPASTARVMLRETKTFATTGNHFFGRLFLYFDYVPDPLHCFQPCKDCDWTCDNLIHYTIAAAGGQYVSGNTKQDLSVRAVGAVNQNLLVNIDYGGGTEVGLDDKNGPAGYQAVDASHRDQWMCFEFEFIGQGDNAEIRVWWDGREHPAMHYSKSNLGGAKESWHIPTFQFLEFGFEHYQDYSGMRSQMDAWLDEIVVDDERIGCAR
ncbi:MAG: hypothetical protein QM778_38195 [Myxococcales bacterium]